MARSQPITKLEIAACPMHRDTLKHYRDHEVGCDCMTDDRRAELSRRLELARAEGNPLAEMAD